MTDVQQLQDAARQVRESLTAPGQRFEIADEDVLGVTMKVFTNRATSLGLLLAESVRYGDQHYLVTADRQGSFAEHARQVASLATALRDDYGVGPGDRVAITAANSPEWVVAF